MCSTLKLLIFAADGLDVVEASARVNGIEGSQVLHRSVHAKIFLIIYSASQARRGSFSG